MKNTVATALILSAGAAAAAAQTLAYPCDTVPSSLKPRLYFSGPVVGSYFNQDCQFLTDGRNDGHFSIGYDPWDVNPITFELTAAGGGPDEGVPLAIIENLRFSSFDLDCKNGSACNSAQDVVVNYNLDTANAMVQAVDALNSSVPGSPPGYQITLNQTLSIVNDTGSMQGMTLQAPDNTPCGPQDPINFPAKGSSANVTILFSNSTAQVSIDWANGDQRAQLRFYGEPTMQPDVLNKVTELDQSDPHMPKFGFHDGTNFVSYGGGYCYSDKAKTAPKSGSSRILPGMASSAAMVFGVVVAMLVF